MATEKATQETQKTPMKKLLPLFFILFSVGALSAQNLNFKDTNGLKTLLCSHTWYRYYLNPDSSFSDRVMDSIKFYPNRTFYESARPKDDSVELSLPTYIATGKWYLGSMGRATRGDTATDCISINLQFTNSHNFIIWNSFTLVDWNRIKKIKLGKMFRNIDFPFLGNRGDHAIMSWDIKCVWQPRRQFKKPKKH